MNDNITLGVAIITRNRIEQLKRLLPQLTKFDQVVICDTGSHDGTEQYVRKLGKPFQFVKFPWRDRPTKNKPEWGFNAARNESFRHLKTTHAIWLDTDDVIGQVKGTKETFVTAEQAYGVFKKIATEAPPQVDVWFIKYVYSRDENGNPNVVHTRERMVKLSTGWKWVYPIHECLAPDRKPEHSVVTDLDIIHLPSKIVEGSSERNMSMLKIWLKQLEEQGNHHDLQRCRLNIGETLFSLGEDKESADWLVSEFLRKHPESLDIEKWHAWVYVAKAQMALANFDAAKAAALAAIDLEPGLPDGYLLLGQIKLVSKGDPMDVLLLLDQASRCDDPPSQLIINPLDYTFTPFCVISDCRYQLGNYQIALDFALKAQAIAPNDPRAEFLRSQAATAVRRGDAVNAAKALFQLYLDYDENEKAARLYEFLPYVAQQDQEIIDMAKIANKRVRHIFDRKEYIKLYENNSHWAPSLDEWIEQENPPGLDRYNYIMSRLKKALPNGGRVLDVGCSDGFHSLLYAKHGYQVVGVDLDKRCVDLANERAKKWNLPAVFVHGYFEEMQVESMPNPLDPTRNWIHEFDAVVCSEVLEHVPDPAFLLGSLADCAKENAPVILTTPDEAFDKGDTPAGGGAYDHNEEISGHVRVFTQESFEALLKSNPEFYCVDSHFVEFTGGYRTGQGWQCGEIRRAAFPQGPVIRIYCGEAVSFNPDMINTGGIGGSETAVIHMANAWARMGCQVVVYSGQNGIWDGVFYRTANHFNIDQKSDVFIAWRWPLIFSQGRPNATTTILWMHDIFAQLRVPGYQPNEIPKAWADNIDYVMVLSEFHKQCVENVHKTLRGKVVITRNGIDPMRYTNRNIEKVQHRYIYSSSYDRGLEQLLEIWPDIKKAIPDAELHVAYGTQTSEMIYSMTGEKDKLNQIYRLLGKMNSLPGVTHHERLGQQELADLQLSCEAWLYPYQDNEYGGFLETYCITALEIMAARCVPIARNNGALKEIVQHCHVWGPDMTVENLIEILKDKNYIFKKEYLDENQKYAMVRSWDSLAVGWAKQLAPKEEPIAVGSQH